MGVYIKGMEIPKKIEPGLVVEFGEGIDGKRYARLHHYRYGALTDWLEAVPVTEHGDLIERKAVYLTDFEIAMCDGDYKEAMKMLLEKIESAPTIIRASEDGEA